MNIAPRPGLAVLIGAFVWGAPGNLRAQAPGGAAAANPRSAGAAVTSKDYTLAHVSTFDAPPAGQRNPFWPIGWVPTAPLPTAVVQTQLDVRAEQFVVTSISVDYPPLAVVNGKTRAVGDRIPVSADNREYVSVKQIVDGQVVLDYHGHELRARAVGTGLSR